MRQRPTLPDEAGFALVEVMVSALVAVMVTGGVIALLNVTGRAGAEQRHRVQAFAIAQEDQARLRGMRIPSLNNYSVKRDVSIGGTTYKVESTGTFINNTTSETTCGTETSSADYVLISSTVRWPTLGSQKPVVIKSIVSPITGSLDPTRGGLAVSAINSAALPLSGVEIKATGPESFSGTTDETGCAFFFDKAAGSYSVKPSAPTGYIDKDGKPPASQSITIAAKNTANLTLRYDLGGSILTTFKYRVGKGSTFDPTTAESIIVSNVGMETAKVFKAAGGGSKSTITASPLFPFSSEYSVYAGTCASNNPNPTGMKNPPGAAAIGSVVVPPGAAAPVTLQLPVLNVSVFSGTSSKPGSGVSKANVVVTDKGCSVKRTYTTDTSGNLTNVALPWGTYEVCADNGSTSSSKKQTVTQAVQNLTDSTTVKLYLGTSGLSKGPC